MTPPVVVEQLRDIRTPVGEPQLAEVLSVRLERVRQLRYELWLNARAVPWRHDRGQALIEYALIISLIALVAIVALQTTGTDPASIMHSLAGEA